MILGRASRNASLWQAISLERLSLVVLSGRCMQRDAIRVGGLGRRLTKRRYSGLGRLLVNQPETIRSGCLSDLHPRKSFGEPDICPRMRSLNGIAQWVRRIF